MSVLLAFSLPPSVSSFDLFVSLSQRHPIDHKTMSSKTLPPMCLAGALFLDKDVSWCLEGNLWYFQLSAPIMNLTASYNWTLYRLHASWFWEVLPQGFMKLLKRNQTFSAALRNFESTALRAVPGRTKVLSSSSGYSLYASSGYKLDAFSQSCSDLEVWRKALHAFKHYHTSFSFIANLNVTCLYLSNYELSEKIVSWWNILFLISTTFPWWLRKLIQWIMES